MSDERKSMPALDGSDPRGGETPARNAAETGADAEAGTPGPMDDGAGVAGFAGDVANPDPHPTAQIMGYGGLLPFFGLALNFHGSLLPLSAHVTQVLFLGYAVAILSFVGAIHWGLALADQNRGVGRATLAQRYTWSVIPALLAWSALLVPIKAALSVMAVGYLAALVIDLKFGPAWGYPRWFLKLRRHLTLGVLASILVAILGLA